MDYHAVERRIKEDYRQASAKYRQDDEIEVESEHHRRLSSVLKGLCCEYPHRVRVLDVGCGTGRYFHCLQNVEHLTGIDVSEEMLAAAEDPVRRDHITIPGIELRNANAYLVDFPECSFDLIYSLGMFGYGCPVTLEICDNFHRWLRPGGTLFYNTVDFACLPPGLRLRMRAKSLLFPLLPRRLKLALSKRARQSPFFSPTRRQLLGLMRQTPFKEFEVESHVCASPLWEGRHLECVARKAR